MQAVRSRAGNLRSCQCQAWPRAATATARLATRSAPGRRKILASDVFTACYTGIMATVAVLDAGRKDKRRKELDDKLDKAKNKLAVLMEQSAASDLAQIITDAPLYPDSLLSNPRPHWSRERALLHICELNPRTIESVQRRVWAREVARTQPRKERQLPWYEGDTRLGLAECTNMVATEEEYHMKEREPRTVSHFERAEHMLSELVDRLLFTAYSTMPAQTRRPATALDSAFNMIRMVRSDGYPRYVHPKLDREATAATRSHFNEVNGRIFADWDPRRKDKLVAKICYNILVLKVPPGIKNYNALISGFTEAGEHDLAEVIVESFLFKSQLRPTKATIMCLLHHYRLKKDVVGFQNALQRMTGFDPRGLGLRRRTIEEAEEDRYLRKWVRRSKAVKNHGYVVQPVGLCGHTCEVILQGLLDFGMLKEAARFFVGCLKDGFAIGTAYTQRLLDSCVGNMHRMAVKILVDGLLCHLEEARLLLFGRDDHSLDLSRKVRYLLNIAWATWYRMPYGLPSPRAKALTSPHPSQPSSFTTRLRALGTLAWAEELSNFLEAADATLGEVKQALFMEMPLLDRLSAAEQTFDRMAVLYHDLYEVCKSASRMAKHTRLRLERRFSADRIKSIEVELASAMSRPAPFSTIEVQSIPVENWIALFWDLRDPSSSASRVVRCFERSKSVDKDLRSMLVELLGAVQPLAESEREYSLDDVRDMGLMELFDTSLKLLRSLSGQSATDETSSLGSTLMPWALKPQSAVEIERNSRSRTWGGLGKATFVQNINIEPCQG